MVLQVGDCFSSMDRRLTSPADECDASMLARILIDNSVFLNARVVFLGEEAEQIRRTSSTACAERSRDKSALQSSEWMLIRNAFSLSRYH